MTMDEGQGDRRDEHPDLLPWLASDRIDGATAAEVRRHVDGCAACRREIEALLSLKDTMRRHDVPGHVSIADLVAYEGGEAPESVGPQSLESHFAVCTACAEDLAALRRSRERLEAQSSGENATGGTAPRRQGPGIRLPVKVITLAAAAIVVVAVSLVLTRGMRPERDRMEDLSPAMLSPTLRGAADEPVLAGEGPWALTILLPLGSVADRYAVTVERRDGSPLPGFELGAAAARQGTLTILLPRLPAPGDFVLKVRSAAAPGSESIDYRFSTSR